MMWFLCTHLVLRIVLELTQDEINQIKVQEWLSWQRIGLWDALLSVIDLEAIFLENVYVVLQHFEKVQQQVFGLTI